MQSFFLQVLPAVLLESALICPLQHLATLLLLGAAMVLLLYKARSTSMVVGEAVVCPSHELPWSYCIAECFVVK